MKKTFLIAIISLFVLGLAACGSESAGELSEDKIKIGVTAGPHEQMMEKVKEIAAEDGLDIEIVVFTDYPIVNVALAEGDLDANSFQHLPYLEQFKEDRDLDLVEIATTVNFPMGIYSSQLNSVDELQEGDRVGLPNDPTNGARALILFEQAGLITLEEGAGAGASVRDIVDNPLNLQFIELEAAQIPRQLDELAAAAINTNFAVEFGFVPTRDSIFIEPNDSPWVNIIAVRSENQNDAVLEKLIKAYHSDEVKQFVEDTFEGSVVASW